MQADKELEILASTIKQHIAVFLLDGNTEDKCEKLGFLLITEPIKTKDENLQILSNLIN